ncbi:YdeI/OmpD-associated family protein [Fibrella forsythiae]|uniref:YdeI/OmpD-associated family protein n=1 Tax=Fibrella forsythiae TaxID=2817061 RepID=A0ABS3JPG9_9BACT|nr:YdeI/OmpD-associated family protein [Fibrella forsythiae]MBO0951892.1 YdeI/OmpD-associated family protein [Fibrella forsythiae]
MVHTDGVPIVAIHSRAEWRNWLMANHASSKGVWLMSYKAATGKPTITYAESVLEALCFGWIDSKPNKFDDERSLLYYCPRKPRSNWSGLNKVRVAQLIEQGLMTPAGQRMIDLAKETGTWTALDEVEAVIIPADLQAALAATPPAEKHFSAFPKSVKQGILQWILTAKRPETRANRILETATLAAQNIRANQFVKK